jgi:transglutaminase-like putative cysteine protease
MVGSLLKWIFPRRLMRSVKWVPLILLITLISLLAYSFADLRWRVQSPPLFSIAIVAALLAVLINKTRWHVAWGLFYSLLLAVAFAFQLVGNVMPLQNISSFDFWLEHSNWQIFLFFQRLSEWQQVLFSNRVVQDEGFYSFIFILSVWMISFWLVLIFLRIKNAWLALLPLLFQVAWNTYTYQSNILLLSTTLIAALCLVATGFFQNNQFHWEQHQIDFPSDLWIEWVSSVLVVSLLVVAVANVAPTVTTPEGWQKISDWIDDIRTARQSTEGQQNIEIPSDPSAAIPDSQIQTRILQPPDVTLVGAPLIQDEGAAMWVRTNDSTPHHWRAAIYTSYTGRGWVEAEYDPVPIDALPLTAVPAGRKTLDQTFILEKNFGTRLFAASDPIELLSDDPALFKTSPDGSIVLFGDVKEYSIRSWVPDVSEENLRNSHRVLPPEIARIYLQLPDSLPKRVRTLAERLVQDQTNPFDIAVLVQNYLRESVPYNLLTPPPAEDQDVVDYFLFEASSGFCSYYASAMVVILRTQSIPARIVTGFASGDYQIERGYFYVPAKAPHAWVEVYFPGYGWIPFEPTPSQLTPDYSQQTVVSPPIPRMLTYRQAQRWTFILQTILAIIIGLIALFIGRRVWIFSKKYRQLKKDKLHPAVRVYRQLRYQLADSGIPLSTSQTPHEFLLAADQFLCGLSSLSTVLKTSTSLYEKTIYSPMPPEREEMDMLKNQLRFSMLDRLQLWSVHKRKQLTNRLFRRKNRTH